MKSTLLCCLALALALMGCRPNMPRDVAQAYKALPAKVDYNLDVRPILSDRCFQCHGPDENTREADLRLDTPDGPMALLESGVHPVVPGRPNQSELVHRILHEDPDERMPPEDVKIDLSASEKAMLIKWVDQGAPWASHWAFTTPELPAVPRLRQRKQVRNPIDAFLLDRLQEEGLSFSAPASKETLLRRVSFDLTGLPPTLDELDAFLADDNPDAYEQVVDRLLASPAYGERWAWDWLDAARYADTNGFQGDPERTMYPWRDWVVEAINQNMPYDRFTVEQLAGDLLDEPSQPQMIATGFNRNHMYNGEGGRIAEETRVENVFDRVETVGTVWLGLTVTCSRCHDHKFDPLTQREYYQLFDYFNQTSEDGQNANGKVKPVLDVSPPEDQERLAQLQAEVEEIGARMGEMEETLFPHGEGETPADSPNAEGLIGENVDALSQPPHVRNSYYLTRLIESFTGVEPAYEAILKELRDAVNARNKEIDSHVRVMVMDHLEEPRESFILERGVYDKPGEQVFADVPAFLPPLSEEAPRNRLGLAQWLVDPEHPLTARVTVNRFWQSVFGTGLVKTPEDFGIQGAKPSHPELLDWLAVTFVESGWDVKELVRLMVTSTAYRQSSKISPEMLELDPENLLLARGSRYRMPSWMIRDQALAVSGLLVDSLGGPPVFTYQPAGIWQEATFGQKTYVQDSGEKLYRRTLYTFWRRIVGPTMLFDVAARQTCSVKPPLTNTPMHALVTLNDITYVEAARVMASRVMGMTAEDGERIQTLFRLATSRWPDESEQAILNQRLETLRLHYEANESAALDLLAVGDWPRNEALDPADHAAWAGLATVVLNLDETISKQ